MSKWTKKIDKMHFTKDGKTLCGRPCLGNNYATAFPDREMCEECEGLSKVNKMDTSLILLIAAAIKNKQDIFIECSSGERNFRNLPKFVKNRIIYIQYEEE